MENVAIELEIESESYNCFNSTEFRCWESSEAQSVTETPTGAEARCQATKSKRSGVDEPQ